MSLRQATPKLIGNIFITGARKWWVAKYHRIILFWVIAAISTVIVATVISTDWVSQQSSDLINVGIV